jgi:hypothetical protein|tara:strand:- start:223 stop:666 length:444 start_codon:yes stop_codon:yes gene_type:complete
MALSYQDARKLKREFREKNRPAIRAKLTKCHHVTKMMGEPTGELDDKLVRKYNTLSIKMMSHAHNKTLPEARKNFDKLRVVVDKLKECPNVGNDGIEAMNDGIKAMLELLIIVKTVCAADEVFKAHKEQKHKKLARASKKARKGRKC